MGWNGVSNVYPIFSEDGMVYPMCILFFQRNKQEDKRKRMKGWTIRQLVTCDVLLAEDAGIPLLSTSLWRCSGDSVLLELGENMWTKDMG